MNKPKAQGTAWESAFVRMAQNAGLMADRMPEGGMNDVGDVWIGDTPSRQMFLHRDIPVVAWSRLVKNGTTRRIADGERSVVVMSTEDFLAIAFAVGGEYAFTVECKATQTLNVTRALANTKRKLTNWKNR